MIDNNKCNKCNEKYNKHESLGFNYLLSLGYDINDIVINRVYSRGSINRSNIGKADLTTINDNKNWEVKKIVYMFGKSKIIFTKEQIQKMNKDTTILIFDNGKKESKKEPELVDIIKFGDIFLQSDNKKYEYVVQMELDLQLAIIAIDSIKELEDDKKKKHQQLQELRKIEHQKYQQLRERELQYIEDKDVINICGLTTAQIRELIYGKK